MPTNGDYTNIFDEVFSRETSAVRIDLTGGLMKRFACPAMIVSD